MVPIKGGDHTTDQCTNPLYRSKGIHAALSESRLFAGSDQPERRSFDIVDVVIRGESIPIETRDVIRTPFYAVTEFARSDTSVLRNLLVVPPLSGHFSLLLRDLVIGLIPDFRVYTAEWINARHIAVAHGPFPLDANIACVRGMIERLGAGLTVVALCQGGVPALAATALLAAADDPRTPSALVLMAAPIDPLANPTRVVRLLRSRPLAWFESNVITTVPEDYAGNGRRVYPAHLQLAALWSYMAKRVGEGGEIRAKLLYDDGVDPWRFPFLDLFTSIMDLDARYFLENTKMVYQDCALSEGALCCYGEPVDPQAIRKTALLTVEGQWDDIAAPGQTSAAHAQCTSLPQRLRRQIIVPGSGHFSLFHGETWRREVLPQIRDFCGVETRRAFGAARHCLDRYQGNLPTKLAHMTKQVPSKLNMRQPTRCNMAILKETKAVTAADEVRHIVGSVTDHTLAEILDTQPSLEELEVAVIFARGEGDTVDRLGHELSGKSARIYDILSKDELYQNDER